MKYILLFALLCVLAGCDQKYSTQKLGANDPFKSTMVPSEFFSINADKDNVIEGANGTTVALPKGCFKDKNGNIVTENISVELAEALTLDKMLASNLTTTSDGNQLETDGMIYLNAKANGEDLTVNKDKPLYIEIPTQHKRPGMMVYQGVRDDKGNMNWIKPKKTEVFLKHVDINELDFLPDRFEAETRHELSYAGYKVPNKDFVDSLYYSFSTLGGYSYSERTGGSSPSQQQLNEPHDNPNKKIVNGAYTKESYNYSKQQGPMKLLGTDTASADADILEQREIDPARIRALRDPHFNNTLIATREFEKRLKYIFKTCNKDILEIYVRNLDKNMWELDQMAADKLGTDPLAKRFRKFAAEKLTNVKDAPEQAKLMQDYYEEQLAKSKDWLTANHNKLMQELAAKQKTADSVSELYETILWKREKYRMERYGFTWTDMGWINIDTGTVPKINPAVPRRLEVRVSDAKKFDRVHVYIVFQYMKSLYKLNTTDNILHYAGNDGDRTIDMQLNKKAVLVAVAYQDTNAFMGVKDYQTGTVPSVSMSVSRSSQAAINAALQKIEYESVDEMKSDEEKNEGYLEENSAKRDLEFQDFFYQENKRQKKLDEDQQIRDDLYKIVYPCYCNGGDEYLAGGRNLFESNCASCHSVNVAQTGPALAGIMQRHSREWVYSFTRNWQKLVASGDKEAIKEANYSPSQMNLFPGLKDKDLKMLYDYIECEGGNNKTARQ